MKAPKVTQVLPDLPILGNLIQNLYNCHYAQLFVALATLEQTYLLPLCLLAPHVQYYMRKMRVKVTSP